MGRIELLLLYASPLKMKSAKQRDISILEFIPPIYHPLYHGLVEDRMVKTLKASVSSENEDTLYTIFYCVMLKMF